LILRDFLQSRLPMFQQTYEDFTDLLWSFRSRQKLVIECEIIAIRSLGKGLKSEVNVLMSGAIIPELNQEFFVQWD